MSCGHIVNPRVSGILLGILVVATFATGIIVYPYLPAQVAGHWNAAGAVTNTLPRFWGAFTLPLIMLVLWGLWALLPRIDPISPGFKGFRYVYDFFWIIVTAYFAYAYALTLEKYFGWSGNIYPDIAPGLAVIYIVAGALMPRIKRNWFFAIAPPGRSQVIAYGTKRIDSARAHSCSRESSRSSASSRPQQRSGLSLFRSSSRRS